MARIKVGDKAKLISKKGALEGFNVGDVVEIKALKSFGYYQIEVNNGRYSGFTDEENLEIIGEYPEFHIGDKVRILDVDEIMFGYKYFRNGDITEVTRIYECGQPYLKRLLDMEHGATGDDLVILPDEFHAIEKVEEPAKKQAFKVGDKVRVTEEVDEHKVGKEDVISYVDTCDSRLPYELEGGGWINGNYIELIPEEDLESRILDLEARVGDLEVRLAEKSEASITICPGEVCIKGEVTLDGKVIAAKISGKTPNEKRKEVIEKAKKFIEEVTKATDFVWARGTVPEFIVNENKRTVVALARGKNSGIVWEKGIAKCAPADVFNADIGKAIALGRAYGLDVSEFEEAPQPDEVVPGMEIETLNVYTGKVVTGAPTRAIGITSEGYPRFSNGSLSSVFRIKADTEAQY